MSNQEILEKAIRKAINGGWKMWNWEGYRFTNAYGVLTGIQDSEGETMGVRTTELIFNHDFAKALWDDWKELGHGTLVIYKGNKSIKPLTMTLPIWQYHLQQMVISEDPIKYLGERL